MKRREFIVVVGGAGLWSVAYRPAARDNRP
jgi:hypothetical protein